MNTLRFKRNIFMLGHVVLVFILLALKPHVVVAAESDLINHKSSFDSGRIWKIDGYKVPFSSINIGKDTITYMAVDSTEEKTIPTNQVIKIEVEKGSEAGKWALSLGAPVFLGAIIGVQSGDSEGVVDSSVKTNIVVGLTAVCALVGYVTGSSKKKYESVYKNPEYEPKSKLNILPGAGQTPMGLTLSYRF